MEEYVYYLGREELEYYIKVRTIKKKTEKHFLTYIWYLKKSLVKEKKI